MCDQHTHLLPPLPLTHSRTRPRLVSGGFLAIPHAAARRYSRRRSDIHTACLCLFLFLSTTSPTMSDQEGEAADVVCVQGLSSLYSTEFHVKFSRSSMPINLFGSSGSDKTEEDLQVRVTCNGHFCLNVLAMMNYSTRMVVFMECDGSFTNCPSSEILRNLGLLRGRNTVLFECQAFGMRTECSVFLWSVHDKIVVVDIDGTLTRSDVRGYVETVYLGRYDYVHEGAVSFFSSLEHTFGVRLLFLTSRPMHHFSDTRAFLHLVHNQKGDRLPTAPLFTNKETVMRAIYRELWAKTTAQFKGSVLVDVLGIFVAAGCTESPFCLGVGNKQTDALAYQMAGVKSSRILLVQKNSEIRIAFHSYMDNGLGDSSNRGNVVGEEAETQDLVFTSYADPSLMEYVYRKLAACGLDRQNESVFSRSNSFNTRWGSNSSCGVSPSGDDERVLEDGIPQLVRASSESAVRTSGPPMPLPPPPMPIRRLQSVPAALTAGAVETARVSSPEWPAEAMPPLGKMNHREPVSGPNKRPNNNAGSAAKIITKAAKDKNSGKTLSSTDFFNPNLRAVPGTLPDLF